MAFNGQTKFTKISSQNYTNILYSDSDSDSVPDLKLPPIRGKKLQRRKRSSSGKHENPFCNFWTVLKLITAILIVLALAFMSAVCFWTFRQIKELRQQMTAEHDNAEKVAAEIVKMKLQLAEVNATVMSVKGGLSSLPQITITVADVQKKFEELENTYKKLQQYSYDSNALTSKVEILSRSLNAMKSDIGHMNGTVLLQQVNFENSLRELEIQSAVRSKNLTSSRVSDSQEMMNFTESQVSDLKNLRKLLDQQSARVKILEDFTKSYSNISKSDQDNGWMTELVTRLVQEKISNLTIGAQVGTSQALPAINSVDNGRFLAFRADVLGNFQQINETLDALNLELDEVSHLLSTHNRVLVNLTVAVMNITNKSVAHSPGQNKVVASVNVTPSSTEWNSEGTSSSTSSLRKETLSNESNMTRAVIHIDGINTREDLHKAFQKHWPLTQNQVDVDALNDIGHNVVDKDELKKFDADNNGLFSEDELAVALGFHHQPRCDPPLKANFLPPTSTRP